MKTLDRQPVLNDTTIQAFASSEGLKFVTVRNKVTHEAAQVAGGWKVTRTKAKTGEVVGHVDFFANVHEIVRFLFIFQDQFHSPFEAGMIDTHCFLFVSFMACGHQLL